MRKNYILFLSLIIASLSFGQELMLNGDFESWDDSTTPTSYSKAESTMQETVEFHGGANSAKHTGGTSDIAQTVTGIIPGETYTISLWYKFEVAGNARMWSTWKAGTTTLADNADVLHPSTYLDSSGTTWAEYSATLIAPATADSFYFEVRTYGSTVVYWDDFSVFKEATATPPLQITTSVCATATSVRLTGPWWGWNPTGGPEAVSNNDGTWTFTFDPAPTDNMEYLLVVDGVQENLISIMANGGTCAPVTDSANYANRQWILDSGDVTNNYGQCGTTCVAPVITLLGGDETITVGDTYTDAGATASDDEQGDITGDILGITDLDTSVAGEYTVAYNVSDGALNAATEVVRTVTVEAANVTSFPYCSSFDTDLGDWSTEATQGTSNWESASSSNNSVAAYSGGGSAYYYSGNYNGDSSVLISRPMDITALASPQVTFQIANPSWGADQDVLEVWYKATAADAWSVLGTYSDATTTFSEVTLNLPNASNDYYIAFNATSGYGYGVLIDDVCIAEGPSCLDPTDLAVADITTTTASVSWTADSSQTAWEYQVVAGGATPAETGEATSDNPLALTGLTSNTTYDVYVRANCGTDGTSEWVMVSFITECDAVTAFPYTEDFDTDWSCWSVNNADGDSYTWSQSDTYITPRSGDFTAHGMGSNNDYLISPKFSLTGNERVVWYDIVESASYNNTYDVLLSTTGKEISDFTVNLGTYDCTNVTWTEHILNLSAYTGDIYIALHQTNSASPYYGFGVDDFTVMENPSCIDPTDVTVADITTTTASVSWTADSSQTAWEYQVVAGGATPAETGEATSDNPLALTGLTSNTTYDVYVRANCGTDGTSEWVMVSFTTLPDPIVPDYTNDFTTFPGDLWSEAAGAIADGPAGTTSLWDTKNFAHGTNAPAAYINIYSTNRDEWLISPSFDLSGVNYYLNVDVAATEYLSSFSTADPVDAIWGVDDFVTLMVSEDSGSTWTELYRWDANNNPGVAGAAMPEIDLSAYTGLAKFAFYAESTASNEDIDFFVDNFSITSTSLGLEDVNTTSNFTYFPNPVNNVLSIKAQASIDSITVYNMLGQTVVRSTPNTTTTAVDMSGLQTGAYFVQVAINNSIETVRVIKN
ncbi:DUF5011 domain-containing protein [Flavobacteriaceae bacterium]|nr:DUF5011 domain-containing protein [Flavobacteriaceae bacterium]MDA7727592.1 DUF5011 domain-containing protein [Flavobacteriaceae bacterium]